MSYFEEELGWFLLVIVLTILLTGCGGTEEDELIGHCHYAIVDCTPADEECPVILTVCEDGAP